MEGTYIGISLGFLMVMLVIQNLLLHNKIHEINSLLDYKLDHMEKSLKDKLNGFLIVFQKSRDNK
jgi:hypothetical protein